MNNTNKLILVGGLPASGKTTIGRKLAIKHNAIFLCPDEWLAALDIGLKDSVSRSLLNKQLANLAEDLIIHNQNVVLELALWKKSERDKIRKMAKKHGKCVILFFLDPPMKELLSRLNLRNRDTSDSVGYVSQVELLAWAKQIERPTHSELMMYDTLPENL